MTRAEKLKAAEIVWSLIKSGRKLSKKQIADLELVSRATIATMRAKLRQILATGDESLLQMTWAQALRWTPDGAAERKMQELAEQLVATATELAHLVGRWNRPQRLKSGSPAMRSVPSRRQS
jgi:hypothetical protein